MLIKSISILILINTLQSCDIYNNQLIGKYELHQSERKVTTSKIILRKNHSFKRVDGFFEKNGKTKYKGSWEFKNDTITLKYKEMPSRIEKYKIEKSAKIKICLIEGSTCYSK